jgi:hypothetical protein
VTLTGIALPLALSLPVQVGVVRRQKSKDLSALPPGSERLFHFSKVFRATLSPPPPFIYWVPGTVSVGVKRPGARFTSHLQLADVKNEWICTSTSPCAFVVWTGTSLLPVKHAIVMLV